MQNAKCKSRSSIKSKNSYLCFTAERAENAEALENPSMNWKTLKLCALCDLRVDKALFN